MARVLATIALILAFAVSPASHAELTGVASVIDGDTIEINGTRVRLHGIDAPESAQLCIGADERPWRCGQRASFALADRIGRATVTCRRTSSPWSSASPPAAAMPSPSAIPRP